MFDPRTLQAIACAIIIVSPALIVLLTIAAFPFDHE